MIRELKTKYSMICWSCKSVAKSIVVLNKYNFEYKNQII